MLQRLNLVEHSKKNLKPNFVDLQLMTLLVVNFVVVMPDFADFEELRGQPLLKNNYKGILE